MACFASEKKNNMFYSLYKMDLDFWRFWSGKNSELDYIDCFASKKSMFYSQVNTAGKALDSASKMMEQNDLNL